jgi:uncharacterized membrane protein YecN with MAPEG domain
METHMPTTTLLYAAIFGVMNIALAFPAGRMRGTTGVSVGDGGNPQLTLAMRRHANFTEYMPLALILLGLLEANGLSSATIHIFGALLFLFRLLHAFGLNADSIQSVPRGLGAGGTALVTVVMSIWAIVLFFQ